MSGLTEDQARRQWCPFARSMEIWQGEGSAVNRSSHGTPDENAYCLGSRCMAWRWVLTPEAADSQNKREGRVGPIGRMTTPKPQDPTGYCGLAGPLRV